MLPIGNVNNVMSIPDIETIKTLAREEVSNMYALIMPSSMQNDKIVGELVRYLNHDDSRGHELFITKNELNF